MRRTPKNLKWSPEETAFFTELAGWIEDGWYDHCISEVIELLKERKSEAIKVGDHIVINVPGNSAFSRTYNGLTCLVTKVNAKSVSCQPVKATSSGYRPSLRLGYDFFVPAAS